MNIQTKFYDLKSDKGDLIKDWDFIAVDDDVRVYYKLNDLGGGFEYYSLRWAGNDGRELFTETCDTEILMHGWALYDGNRHMFMGREDTDNENYLHYASFDMMARLFVVLHGLALIHCSALD